MRDTNNIALVLKSGGDYSLDDVNLIAKNIRKYWRGENPLNIYCFTDYVKCVTETISYTLLPLPNPNWNGWWSKMNLFSPDLEQYRPFLFMDLDTMVVGDLSKEFFPENGELFITLENIGEKGRIGSGVMQVPNGDKVKEIWKRWVVNPIAHSKIHRGDQDFIQYITQHDEFWQDRTGRIDTAKPHFRMRTAKPRTLDIVYFHGYPRIPEAAKKYEWVKDYVNGTY